MYSVDCLSSWSCSFVFYASKNKWQITSKTLFVELRKRQSSSRNGDKAYISCHFEMKGVALCTSIGCELSGTHVCRRLCVRFILLNEIVCSCRRSSALLHEWQRDGRFSLEDQLLLVALLKTQLLK